MVNDNLSFCIIFSVTYEGDNFVRFSGDTQKMATTQSKINAVVLYNIMSYNMQVSVCNTSYGVGEFLEELSTLSLNGHLTKTDT